MERVRLDLRHCYGIKSLAHEFEFKKAPAFALYAPNGVMKSSLAETFQDAANGRPSSDRIFPDRETARLIQDENGTEIAGERILVVPSYDSEFQPNEKTSTLLVSAELRRESEQLEARVEEAKEALLKAMRSQAKSRKDFAAELSEAVTRRSGAFEDAALRLLREVERQAEAPFADLPYDIIFNDKVAKAIADPKVMNVIQTYVRRYNELLETSNYFRKGTFDYYNAGQIAKSLADNGFFNARHTVNLYGGEGTVEVVDQEQLQGLIEAEKEAILTDPQLRKSFDQVQKQLEKNAELREFARFLQNDEAVLSRMDNIEAFREDVLKSYLKANETTFLQLVSTIESVDERRKAIAEAARSQTTQWDKVLTIFNERFYVPFELVAVNKIAVMIGQENSPVLGFRYRDGEESVDIKKDVLLRVLSTGEKRALYIINVIFEIERRRKENIETLVIVDDIADSFDYNNKYAILQYLRDIAEGGSFRLLIMTHNFDFFRTLESRFVPYNNCLMASKNGGDIALVKASGIRNVFAKDWKLKFFEDDRKKIASIPFLRNLVEMTTGEEDERYDKLTSMLHLKESTEGLAVQDLDEIFNTLCGTDGHSDDPSKRVVDLILEQADACLAEDGALKLENKIVLAIGTRLRAEAFARGAIGDDEWCSNIKENQTRKLIERFKKDHPNDAASLSVLDRVELMTPENIHVNSFMYEPIIDMADDHLRALYSAVTSLSVEEGVA